MTFAAFVRKEPRYRFLKVCELRVRKTKRDKNRRGCPASFSVIAIERRPAAVSILNLQEEINRNIPRVAAAVVQRHQSIASRFDACSAAVPTRPSTFREAAGFNFRLKVFDKAHKENEVFQTENLSKNPHTH